MKLFKHFKTITKHKFYVMKLCFRFGLYKQGLKHDLSKYSWTELVTGAKYYLGYKSPNSNERDTIGYSSAWLHHKGRNKHHWEYWIDFTSKGIIAIEMPINYVVEMFCDRVAAGKIYLDDKYTNDNPIEYFLKGNAKTSMHPNTAKLLEGWLMMLQQEGEEKTFTYIKNLK